MLTSSVGASVLSPIEQAIRMYIQQTYPQNPDLISDAEMKELALSVTSSMPSAEKDVARELARVKTDRSTAEYRRCAARLRCLSLLRLGQEGYEAFIQAQRQEWQRGQLQAYLSPLQEAEYGLLAARFHPKQLDDLALDVLRVTTMVSSIPLVQEIKDRTEKVRQTFSNDSVEFLADVFERDPATGKTGDLPYPFARKIYAMVDALYQKYPITSHLRITKLLQAAFAHRQHYRHMLYTEGNEHMFDAFLQGVREKTLDKEAFDFWVAHWTINITGFRGHLNPNGSIYLTEQTFQAMQLLESILAQAFSSQEVTARTLLEQYLDGRSALLKLEKYDLPIPARRALTHVACMLRMYHPEEAGALELAYRLISPAIFADFVKQYFENQDTTAPTPTYAPALFQNVVDHCTDKLKKGTLVNTFVHQIALFNAFVIGFPIYAEALRQYFDMRQAQKDDEPLCFNQAAYADKVCEAVPVLPLSVREFDIRSYVECTVGPKKMVSVKRRAPAEDESLCFQAAYTDKEVVCKVDPVLLLPQTHTPMYEVSCSAQTEPLASASVTPSEPGSASSASSQRPH